MSPICSHRLHATSARSVVFCLSGMIAVQSMGQLRQENFVVRPVLFHLFHAAPAGALPLHIVTR